MWLWLATNINLDKNEDEKCSHTNQQVIAILTNGWTFKFFLQLILCFIGD
jgi:hypothetical protein